MDPITETARPQEVVKISAESLYRGAEHFIRKSYETISKITPQQFWRGALVAGLITEALIITDLSPYKGNPVMEAFGPHPPAQVEAYQPPPDQIEIKSDAQNVGPTPEQNKIIKTEDVLYKNFSATEKSQIQDEISKQLKYYKDHDPERANRILTNWQSTIDAILKLDVKPQDRPFWNEFLAAVLYVEGGGDSVIKDPNQPTPTSEAGAEGPGQVMPLIFQAILKKHGIYNADPKIGWDSIRAERFLLEELLDWYGSPDLTAAAYFGGQPFIDNKIGAVNKNINREQINVVNLGSVDGKDYFIKVAAGILDLKQERANLSLSQTKG